MKDEITAADRLRETMAARRFMTEEQAKFLSQLATLLGMPPSGAAALASPQIFTSPAGQACRLHLHHGEAAVRLDALLPMSASEVAGAQTRQLMLAHNAVLAELGWHLGVSPEGLLQLSCLSWIDTPGEAATAFDLANSIGITLMQSLSASHTREATPGDAAEDAN